MRETTKKDLTNPSSWRPITMQNCIDKLLKAILARRLYYASPPHLIPHCSPTRKRASFLRLDAKSTVSFRNGILNKARAQRGSTRHRQLFYDLESAFPSLNHGYLDNTLRSESSPSNISHPDQELQLYLNSCNKVTGWLDCSH
eukprot:GHVU01207030.1.p1 GENE.GHVU01207030.1~~GHVU01207030.1.p1  ORF type:complete len:153 (-),score=4.47 GHVU01207030.1:77-505(-)